MASAGLVFLLLVSSSLLVSNVHSSPTADDKQEISPKELNKVKEGFKATCKVIVKHFDQIRSAVSPSLMLIPVYGPLINAIFSFAGLGALVINKNINNEPILKALKYEFENVNSKLDQYHGEQTWNSWASGAYYKPEILIKEAWAMYTTLVKCILPESDDNKRNCHKEAFKTAYVKYERATTELHELLNPTGTTLINPLKRSLAEHVNCHEKDIREFTLFINSLIYKANTMNQLYYKLKNIESTVRDDEDADIAYRVESIMFQVHMNCTISGMVYVKKDVEALIDTKKKRQELAKDVRLFLEDAYDRYDWMVVAFITKKSSHKIIETLNRHVLTGFTEVTKEGVSVAVARQVKGTHTMGDEVKKAIKKCIDESVLCYKVADELGKCSELVGGIPVSQTYTAVHAYLRKNHSSHNTLEAPDEDYEINADPEDSSAQTPYISTGNCKKFPGVKGGKFVVLIKSDEEMQIQDPCSKLNCGGTEKGKCVRVEKTFRAMCQCNYPYYGQQCEDSLDKYKRDLKKKNEIQVVDKRRRNNPLH